MTYYTVARSELTRQIKSCLMDRTKFIILPPAHMAGQVVSIIVSGGVDGFSVYADIGRDEVIFFKNTLEVHLIERYVPASFVILIPKTVSAELLGEVLGQEIPQDGSNDIIALSGESGEIAWPSIFLEVMDQVDPQFSAGIRASKLDDGK